MRELHYGLFCRCFFFSGLLGFQLFLDFLGVLVHVLLAAHLLDFRGNTVGQRAQIVMGDLVVGLLLNLDRLTVNHLRLAFGWNHRARLLQFARTDNSGRYNRTTGFKRKPCHTGVPLVHATIRASRALNVDAEQVSIFDNLTCVLQSTKRLVATGTVHGEHAHGSEPPLLELALQPLAFKVFGLAHEVHHTRAGNRNQRIIDDGQMIRGNDGTAGARHIIEPRCGGSKTMTRDGSKNLDEEPVEHLAFLPQTDWLLAGRLIRVTVMTDNQNSNVDGEQPIPTPGNGRDSATPADPQKATDTGHNANGNGAMPSGKHDIGNLDDAWAAFEAEHQADLNDVASSRQAKKFEKQAKKREKEALLSVDDLDIGSFTDDARPGRGRRGGKQSGPRDFTGSSWLDTDNVMDTYDDGGFTPPNPDLGPVKASTVLLVALLIIGLVGETVMIFVPGLNAIPLLGALLNILFGLGVILGLGGLVAKILNRKDRPGDQGGYYDDGARV